MKLKVSIGKTVRKISQ